MMPNATGVFLRLDMAEPEICIFAGKLHLESEISVLDLK